MNPIPSSAPLVKSEEQNLQSIALPGRNKMYYVQEDDYSTRLKLEAWIQISQIYDKKT